MSQIARGYPTGNKPHQAASRAPRRLMGSAFGRFCRYACLMAASVPTIHGWSGAGQLHGAPATGGDESDAVSLVYRFHKGERITMEVTHRARTSTTIAGSRQEVETATDSHKVWTIVDVDDEGHATLEHSVENVAISTRSSDRGELRWDSRTGDPSPPGYEAMSASLGQPLSRVTVDRRGHVLRRVDLKSVPTTNTGDFLVVPLPDGPVRPGDHWTFPRELVVEVPNGPRKSIRTRVLYELETIEDGVATIRVDTTVLTPIDDPRLEVRLLERIWDGKVRFDVARGVVLERSTDTDRRVIGFSGPDSSLHYAAHLGEKLVENASPPLSEGSEVVEEQQASQKGS